MALEENGGVAAVQQQPKTFNEQLTNKEEKAPAQVEQKVDEVENDKEEKKDQAVDHFLQKVILYSPKGNLAKKSHEYINRIRPNEK